MKLGMGMIVELYMIIFVRSMIRSFLSLSAKGTYQLVGNAEEDGEKTRTAEGKKTMPFILGNSCSCIESQKSLHEF